MKPLILVLLLAAALAATGCNRRGDPTPTPTTTQPETPTPAATPTTAPTGDPAALERGVSTGTLEHGGRARTYRLVVPSGAVPAGGWPLVVGLHGGLGSGEQFARNSRFEAAAEDANFVAVFPDGVSRTWNGGGCCGAAARDNVDDVGFLAALIESLQATLPLDPARTFMTGHSNGGIMAFRFGCERPELVRAIGSVAGSLETGECAGGAPVDLLAIHGDSDQNHPLEGGQGPRSIAGVPFTSQADSLALWVEGFGCGREPETSTEGALTRTTWSGCEGGTTATLLVIAGADHPWPGSEPPRIALPNQGVPSDKLDATAALVEFFLGD